MDAPICRLCAAKHWYSEPHAWAKRASVTHAPADQPRTRAAERQAKWRKAHKEQHAANQRKRRRE